jgi:hypothetical protein
MLISIVITNIRYLIIFKISVLLYAIITSYYQLPVPITITYYNPVVYGKSLFMHQLLQYIYVGH